MRKVVPLLLNLFAGLIFMTSGPSKAAPKPHDFFVGPNFVSVWNEEHLGEGVYIFFHGFPAELGTKNSDIAGAVASNIKAASAIMHYSGLGLSKGTFSFDGSIREAEAVMDYLKTRGAQRFRIFGHSWGGLVALNILASRKYNIDGVFLVSPLTTLPDRESVKTILCDTEAEFPKFKGLVEQWLEEIDRLRPLSDPASFNFLPQMQASGMVVQAKDDDVVPSAMTKNFMQKLGPTFEYHEVLQDHSFSDRETLIKQFLDWDQKHPFKK